MRKRESDGENGAGSLEVSGPRKVVDLERRERELDEVVARLRNSDIDLRDYMPDLGTIMREASPERRAERLREALDLERDVTLRQSLSDIAALRAEADPVRLEHKLHELIARAKSNDVELGEYLPDLENIRREVDPARRAKKLRDSLDNPEIDEALAGARTSLARLDRSAPNRGGVASPWAQQAPEPIVIDKAALPSAMMVFAPLPERMPDAEQATTLEKPPAPIVPRSSRRWKATKSVMAVIAVVAPLTMMYFLLVWRNDHGPVSSAPTGSSATSTPPSGPASASAVPASSAEPSSSAVPTLAPTAVATESPTAPPAPTADPHGGKPSHAGSPHAAQPGPSSEPVVVSPLKTAEPAIPPPTPTVTASAPPPPPTASAPFLLRKKEP